MTVTKSYSKKFNAFVEELLTDKEKYTAALSQVDKQLSDCLHFLENEKANAAMLAKVNKKIRELRQARRQLKNNLLDIKNVLGKFKNTNKMNEVTECEYAYRTDVLMEILSE